MPVLRLGMVVACIVAAGCASRSQTVATPQGVAEPAAHHHMPDLPATAGPGFTAADVRFMQHMIGHHAQAVRMAALAPSNGASDGVVRLARKIGISQRDEIVMMKNWLAERRQEVPDEAHAQHAMMMPGMLTDEQFAQLGAARGREFDRLFLTLMTRHHEGALQMVRELFRTPGAGQEPDIFRFATDVDADQRDELVVMERLLHALPD
ncbi:MAG TPA: DUF305 domain-containing protein [Longimicrobium sp.]